MEKEQRCSSTERVGSGPQSTACWIVRPLTNTNSQSEEAKSHSLLSQHKLAPALLARFQNGLIYRFIRGHVCSPSDLTTEPVWRGVARRLAQWHAILPIISSGNTALVQDAGPEIALTTSPPLKSLPSLEAINAITPNLPAPNVWTIMQKWVFALPIANEAERKRKGILQRELERTASELEGTPGIGGNGVRQYRWTPIDPKLTLPTS